jgi:hypothetical protein
MLLHIPSLGSLTVNRIISASRISQFAIEPYIIRSYHQRQDVKTGGSNLIGASIVKTRGTDSFAMKTLVGIEPKFKVLDTIAVTLSALLNLPPTTVNHQSFNHDPIDKNPTVAILNEIGGTALSSLFDSVNQYAVIANLSTGNVDKDLTPGTPRTPWGKARSLNPLNWRRSHRRAITSTSSRDDTNTQSLITASNCKEIGLPYYRFDVSEMFCNDSLDYVRLFSPSNREKVEAWTKDYLEKATTKEGLINCARILVNCRQRKLKVSTTLPEPPTATDHLSEESNRPGASQKEISHNGDVNTEQNSKNDANTERTPEETLKTMPCTNPDMTHGNHSEKLIATLDQILEAVYLNSSSKAAWHNFRVDSVIPIFIEPITVMMAGHNQGDSHSLHIDATHADDGQHSMQDQRTPSTTARTPSSARMSVPSLSFRTSHGSLPSNAPISPSHWEDQRHHLPIDQTDPNSIKEDEVSNMAQNPHFVPGISSTSSDPLRINASPPPHSRPLSSVNTTTPTKIQSQIPPPSLVTGRDTSPSQAECEKICGREPCWKREHPALVFDHSAVGNGQAFSYRQFKDVMIRERMLRLISLNQSSTQTKFKLTNSECSRSHWARPPLSRLASGQSRRTRT